MRREREVPPLRPNWYPDGPYHDSPCIHCRKMLKHSGAHGGITWVPVGTGPDTPPRESGTCWENEVATSTYGGHEPWQAVPLRPEEAR